MQGVAEARQRDEAHVGPRPLGGGPQHRGQQEPQEGEVPHVRRPELDLVAVGRHVGRHGHEPGAGDEHVEAVGVELPGGPGDGGARSEVALEEGDADGCIDSVDV